MRKLIMEQWLSLDGYAVDSKGQLDFFPSTESNKFSDQDQLRFLDSVDTILLGRKTYELFVAFWPNVTTETEIIADKLNETRKIVFSNTLQQAHWGKWPDAEVLQGDAIQHVKKLKQQNGKNIVLWGSLTLSEALMKEDLIDEYHIQICPTTIGGGRKLFPEDFNYRNFALVDLRKYETGVVYLQYVLKKARKN